MQSANQLVEGHHPWPKIHLGLCSNSCIAYNCPYPCSPPGNTQILVLVWLSFPTLGVVGVCVRVCRRRLCVLWEMTAPNHSLIGIPSNTKEGMCVCVRQTIPVSAPCPFQIKHNPNRFLLFFCKPKNQSQTEPRPHHPSHSPIFFCFYQTGFFSDALMRFASASAECSARSSMASRAHLAKGETRPRLEAQRRKRSPERRAKLRH